ncbi:MAG: class I SAM-dependent methyltransferase, partial [Anaeroplasmataceae bacterium]
MKEFNKDDTKSRFIKSNDDQTNYLLYPIPKNWWSRLYEYKWASKFVEEGDVCLDAACGTFHHLKFYLAYLCKEVYACDLDKTVLDKERMLYSIEASFGKSARDVSENIYDKINFSDDDLT